MDNKNPEPAFAHPSPGFLYGYIKGIILADEGVIRQYLNRTLCAFVALFVICAVACGVWFHSVQDRGPMAYSLFLLWGATFILGFRQIALYARKKMFVALMQYVQDIGVYIGYFGRDEFVDVAIGNYDYLVDKIWGPEAPQTLK